MDPITLLLIAGAGLLFLKAKPSATTPIPTAPVIAPAPKEPDLGAVLGGIITGGIAVFGISEIIKSIDERQAREDLRYDNYTNLKLFAAGLRTLPAMSFDGVPDIAIITPFAEAIGVGHSPTAVVGVSMPSWARGAKVVVEALQSMRNLYKARETIGSILPPPITVGAHRDYNSWEWQHSALYVYYRDKGLKRETRLRSGTTLVEAHIGSDTPPSMLPGQEGTLP